MANSITRYVSVIVLSLACFSQQTLANVSHLALFGEHEKPVYLAAFNNKQRINNVPVAKTAIDGSSMEFIFQRDYPIRQIVRHIGSWALIGNKATPVYANTVNSNSLAAIYQLNKQLFDIKGKTSLNQGDVLSFVESGQKTLIKLNNTEINQVTDPVFYYYLANMWLGESVASKRLQEQLLSPSASLKALYPKSQTHKKPSNAANQTAAEKKVAAENKTKTTAVTKKPKALATPKKTAPASTNKSATKVTKATPQKASTHKANPKPKTVANPKPKPIAVKPKPAPQPSSKPSYKPQRQSFEQAQKSNQQRLLLAIDNASFPVEKKMIDAVILFVEQNGHVLSAKVVSSTLKDTTLLSKKLAFISQDISPIVTTNAMQQPGIYAFKINLKP